MAVVAPRGIGTTPALLRFVDSETKTVDQWRGHRNQYFLASANKISTKAMLGSATGHILFFLFLWHANLPPWRIAVGGSAIAALFVSHVYLVRRLKLVSQVEPTIGKMNIIAIFATAIMVTATGGMLSPAAPTLVLPAMIGLLFLGPGQLSYPRIVLSVGMIFAVAALPTSITGPQLDHYHYVGGLLVELLFNVLCLLFVMLKRVADASTQASQAMANVREARISEAEEQSRRLQSVAAKVAHELKNPLACIKGLCQLIAKAPQHARTAERLAVAESEIVRMEHILAEYLTFARPLEDLRLQQIDVADVARDVVEVLDGRAATAGIALVLANAPAPLAADPRRLREALLNLMGNALEATPTGGTISLTTRSTGAGIEIEVVDTGRGIRPEDLARMGTSFFTTRPDGTGLGVVLATSAITQHGGTLRYRSEVGAGTTATIRLPRPEVGA